jgi:hypothetical protein
MAKRESIRRRREVGKPGPWTDDPILSKYRFCNVFREHDRVSQWIHRNVTLPFSTVPHLWIHLALARQVNWPPTLGFLLREGAWRPVLTKARLQMMATTADRWQDAGNKVYTGAYMIHADSNPATRDLWKNKNDYIFNRVVGQLLAAKPDLSGMQAFVHGILPYESWGGFMAYEVACDLRWAPGPHGLSRAPDIGLWANPGPGAVRGLNRLAGRDLKAPLRVPAAVAEMQLLLSLLQAKKDWPVVLGKRIFPAHRPFEMRDVEHTLCEFDKYERVRLGEGRPRSYFTPAKEDFQ